MGNSHRHVDGRRGLSRQVCWLPLGSWHWVSPRVTHAAARPPEGGGWRGTGGRRQFIDKVEHVPAEVPHLQSIDKVLDSSSSWNESTCTATRQRVATRAWILMDLKPRTMDSVRQLEQLFRLDNIVLGQTGTPTTRRRTTTPRLGSSTLSWVW